MFELAVSLYGLDFTLSVHAGHNSLKLADSFSIAGNVRV